MSAAESEGRGTWDLGRASLHSHSRYSIHYVLDVHLYTLKLYCLLDPND